MKKIFSGVAGNYPSLNRFDLSYTNTTAMTFGYLYPVQCDEVYPGDVFKMSAFCHAELMPMVTPVMSDIQLFAHVFFCPCRIIYGVDNEDGKSIFEKFITGGKDGDYDTPLPAWTPSWSSVGFSSRKIWDYVGNPVSYDSLTNTWTPIVPAGINVSVAPRLCYNAIFNNYYRDENLVDEVASTNEDLLKVAFKKDYFTSALEQQQRGIAPALPVDLSVTWPSIDGTISGSFTGSDTFTKGEATPSSDGVYWLKPNKLYSVGTNSSASPKLHFGSSNVNNGSSQLYSSIPNGTVSITPDLSLDGGSISATTFTVSDLRLAFAIQRLLELNERAGYRYTEWLSAHFGVSPTDARLDRPEYIGGCIMNVSVSPLMQSSETATTPQGTKTGVGHVDSVQKLGNYRVLEHGIIMTLVSIRPKPIYSQGVNRQWLRQTRFDYYSPELAWLSETGIFNCELYAGGSSDVDESGNALDPQIFGYQAAWNEMRCKQNMITGPVREQFNHWVLDRKFSSRPALNEDFITIDDGDFNKIFVVQNEDEFIVSWSNLIDAYRPIPAMGIPGLIDHVYGGR